MTDKDRNLILYMALEEACLYMRKYPPAEFPFDGYNDILPAMAGGTHRDPRGTEYMAYFIDRAKKLVDEYKNLN